MLHHWTEKISFKVEIFQKVYETTANSKISGAI